jgi:phosphoribosylaminoimidazolecarboxamide formyltransferase/IMP cyclohydrolase
MLVQNKDNAVFSEIKNATKRIPSKEESNSLLFAMKVCKHVKSNAIVLVKGAQTVGIGAGQMSRIDSLQIAAHKMTLLSAEGQPQGLPLVMASDAFFPFNDVVLESAKAGVKAIIQPGGSVKDADSIAAADANNMAMVMTAMRHFRH